MRRILLLALALGCRPTLARLERDHRYDEALCGVREGAFPSGPVLAAIRRALDPAIHLTVVPPGRAPELTAHALVRFVRSANLVHSLEGCTIDLRLRRGDRRSVFTFAGLPDLAAALGERLPEPRVDAGLADPPTEDQLRRAAPRAAALSDAVIHLWSRCAPDNLGGSCSDPLLVDAPAVEPDDLTLELDLTYRSRCEPDGLTERFDLPLPPGPTLEARVHALFGDRMRRLADLPVRPRRTGD